MSVMLSLLVLIFAVILIFLIIRRTWVSVDLFMKRGLVGGLIGVCAGWIVLYLSHSRRQDGILILWGHPMNNLSYWMFLDFPFVLATLVVTCLAIGRILEMVVKRTSIPKTAIAMLGIAMGGVMGAIAAGVVARLFDYLTLKDFQLELYGYYFVGCAAIIGATCGAIAGAAAGLTEGEI